MQIGIKSILCSATKHNFYVSTIYMKKSTLLICLFLSVATHIFCQVTSPRVDVYGSQGLFLEQINRDDLVPRGNRNSGRLGDNFSFGATVKLPLWKGWGSIGAGVGYKQTHYSMSKYSIGDIIGALFLFDAARQTDTFPLSRVRFVNSYIEVPLSISFHLHNRDNNLFGFSAGINIKPGFLLKSKPELTFDLTPSAAPLSVDVQQKLAAAYTKDASKFVITIQPYAEWSMSFSKGFGMGVQLWPLSYYGSRLNNKFTSFSVEIIGFSASFIYDFNR